VRLEPASTWTHARLAEVFTAGYEGYFTPIAVDEAAVGFMASSWDIDLDASRVAVVDDDPVAICTLAIRGDRGWIGGLGVAAPHRSRGIGAVLMRRVIEEARSRGVRELWLEVLVQNEPAIRLYEALGFEHVRELEVWSPDELVLNQHELPSLPVADALGREERPPWQRANESLAGSTASRRSATTAGRSSTDSPARSPRCCSAPPTTSTVRGRSWPVCRRRPQLPAGSTAPPGTR
jgi:ribosomal protein S18 acetylase RimI-like enzyme